jgi:hypothetical protein
MLICVDFYLHNKDQGSWIKNVICLSSNELTEKRYLSKLKLKWICLVLDVVRRKARPRFENILESKYSWHKNLDHSARNLNIFVWHNLKYVEKWKGLCVKFIAVLIKKQDFFLEKCVLVCLEKVLEKF